MNTETGTTPPVKVWFTKNPVEIRMEAHRSFARQYAVAYIEGKITWPRCERVLKGTRRIYRKIGAENG